MPHHDPETPCVERRTTKKVVSGVVWSLGQFCPCVPKVWTASMPCSAPSPSSFGRLGTDSSGPLIDLFIHLIVVANNLGNPSSRRAPPLWSWVSC